MNIVFIWDNPFKNGGGVGSVTSKLAHEFIKRKFGVCYLAFTNGIQYDDNGVEQYFTPINIKNNVKKTSLFFQDFLKKKNIDIIINQAGIDPNVLNVLSRSELYGAKVISVLHNCVSCMQLHFAGIIAGNYKNSFFLPFIKNPFLMEILKFRSKLKYRRYFKNTIEFSHKFILLSNEFIPELGIFLPEFSKDKIIAIPNPSSEDMIENVESKKENRLLYVGRIEYVQKQVDILIDIWTIIYKKFPDWHLDIVGDGGVLEDLKMRVKKQNLRNIHFYGQTNPILFFERAKYFVLTSAFEGFPMVLIEAQTYGVVPFAFDSFSAISDIISKGENGIIIKSFDIVNYCDELSLLISDETRRKHIAVNAQHSVSKFGITNIVQQWINLFKELKVETNSL